MWTSRALLLATLTTVASASDALVYTFDRTPPSQRSTPPSISPESARLFLAHRLGLSQFHNLEDADEDTLRLLNDYGGSQAPLFEAGDKHIRRLLVIVEGLDDPASIYGERQKPTFKMAPPSSSSNLQLAVDFLNQDRHRRRATNRCKGEGSKNSLRETIQGGISSDDPMGSCMVHLLANTELNQMDEVDKLDVIKASSEFSVKNVFGEDRRPVYLDDSTSIFHVSSLEAVTRSHGLKSKEHKQTLGKLKEVLSDIATSKEQESTVILMPSDIKIAKRSFNPYGSYEMPSILNIREVLDEAPLSESSKTSSSVSKPTSPPKKPSMVNTTIPFCYYSKDYCNERTNNCSGHGECRQKYAEREEVDGGSASCFSCFCTPTSEVKEGSIKTTYWGGPACQKKDVSVPFWLFAGFTVAIVAMLSWAVGLLYSIGDESLPSVLSSGVAPVSRK